MAICCWPLSICKLSFPIILFWAEDSEGYWGDICFSWSFIIIYYLLLFYWGDICFSWSFIIIYYFLFIIILLRRHLFFLIVYWLPVICCRWCIFLLCCKNEGKSIFRLIVLLGRYYELLMNLFRRLVKWFE